MTWGRIGGPFLDSRTHYDYDNADFSFNARTGNRVGTLRSQFGVTRGTYDRWGELAAPSSYYTDHPFLVKAAFQQFTRLAGTGEAASRVFYVMVSFGIAAGLFTIVLETTGSLAAALAGALTLVSIPLFGTFQTCVKFETDGMLLGVWQFAALAAALRRPSRRSLALLAVLSALAFLAHWTAGLSVGLVTGALLWEASRHHRQKVRAAFLATAGGGATGLAATLGLMVFLQHGVSGAWTALATSVARRAAPIPLGEWLAREALYARVNFTLPFLVLVLILAVLFLADRLRRAGGDRGGAPGPLLGGFVVLTAAVASVWLVAFRQGSWVHVYWQYWFTLPAAALVAAAVARPRGRGNVAGLAGLATVALVVFLQVATARTTAGVLEGRLGAPGDIGLLSSLRDRRFGHLVFIPVTDTPFNDWFQGPLFEYYTDRPVVVASPGRPLTADDEVLILNVPGTADAAERIGAMKGVRLAGRRCGPHFCAFTVEPATP